MSFINYASREINCKIVYYGPGLCGKTTNLQFIYKKTNPQARGKMIRVSTSRAAARVAMATPLRPIRCTSAMESSRLTSAEAPIDKATNR